MKGFTFPDLDQLTPATVTIPVLDELDAALQTLTLHYRSKYQNAEREKEKRIAALTATGCSCAYFALIDGHRNENLADVLTNKNDVNVIVEYDGSLVQKSDPSLGSRPRWVVRWTLLCPHETLLGLPVGNSVGQHLGDLGYDDVILPHLADRSVP
ncbi:MAG: hypothetical protein IPO17_05435 [Flavobacteriales bacterium]|nr:hypothetical protein [Flavobacteriales bacterium]